MTIDSAPPGGATTSALKVQLHEGDLLNDGSGVPRNELEYAEKSNANDSPFKNNVEKEPRYMAFSVYFDSSFNGWTCDTSQSGRRCSTTHPSNVFNVFQQWHNSDGTGSGNGVPPFGFVLQDHGSNTSTCGQTVPGGAQGCYDIGLGHYNGSTTDLLWSEPLVTGQWYNFTLYVYFSTNSSTGVLALRKSTGWGTAKTSWVTLTCPSGSNISSNNGCNVNTLDASPQNYSYFKIGHYRDVGIEESTTLWHANVRIGKELTDVEIPAPSASDYQVTANPTTLASNNGASQASTITITPVNGFTGTVSLLVVGVPSGASYSLSSSSISGGSGTSTLTLSPGTAAGGTYPISVCATTGTGACPTTQTDHGVQIDWSIGSAPKPPPTTLSDRFGGTTLDSTKWTQVATSGTLTESGGSLNLTPATVNGAVAIQSNSGYSLTSSYTAVYVGAVVSNAGNVDQQVNLQLDANNYLQWVYQQGTLYANAVVAGAKTTVTSFTYSAATHAWWRVREYGGTMYWETSTDGLAWTNQGTMAVSALFDISNLTVGLRAETFGTGNPSPGTAKFANLNCPPNPGTVTLVDAFTGSSVNSSLWNVTQTNGTVTEGGGALKLTPNANNGSVSLFALSSAQYTFASSSLAVQVKGVLNSGTLDQRVGIYVDGTHVVEWIYQSGTLSAKYNVGSGSVSVGSVTYSATAHAWWRIRESSGTVYWETSADGGIWTTQGSVATASLFALGAVKVRLYAETYASGSSSPGIAKYAYLNGLALASLSYPFTSSQLDSSLWTVTQQTAGLVSEGGGTLNLAPNSGTGSSQLIVESSTPYIFKASSATVHVPGVVSQGGNVDQRFEVWLDSSNEARMIIQSGHITMEYYSAGTKTTLTQISYSPTSHAWLRLRESNGTTYWETSADNITWTSQATASSSSLFSFDAVYMRFYAETFSTGSASPGIAKFQALNPQPVATLVDVLGGSGIDNQLWTSMSSNGVVQENSGTVQLRPAASMGAAYTDLWSRNWYSLGGSSIYAKVDSVVDGGGNVDNTLALVVDAANVVEWLFQGGNLVAIYIKASTKTIVASITYSSTSHAYWRIREASGTTYWETSSDSVTWTQQASTATSNLPPIGGARVVLHAEEFNGGTSTPGVAEYSHLND